jgi:hypothetical protein
MPVNLAGRYRAGSFAGDDFSLPVDMPTTNVSSHSHSAFCDFGLLGSCIGPWSVVSSAVVFRLARLWPGGTIDSQRLLVLSFHHAQPARLFWDRH